MSVFCVGRDTKLKFVPTVRASPSTTFLWSGAGVFAVLMVCGINGSPASVSDPTETYAVARERCGSLTEAMPLTVTNVLDGARDKRPLADAVVMSATLNGLSKAASVE